MVSCEGGAFEDVVECCRKRMGEGDVWRVKGWEVEERV